MHPLLWCYMDRNRHVIELSAKNWINFTLSCKNKSYTVTSHNSGLLLGVGSTGHITIDCYLTNLLFPHYCSTSTVSCTSSNSLILRQAMLQMMHCTLYCFQQANGICLFYPQSILLFSFSKQEKNAVLKWCTLIDRDTQAMLRLCCSRKYPYSPTEGVGKAQIFSGTTHFAK